MADIELAQIQSALSEAAARWQASDTPFVKLSPLERQRLLGYKPGPQDPPLAERERIAAASHRSPGAAARAVGAPAQHDWRDVGGANYITPIENQAGCGSCVAFGTAATLEALARTTRNDPNLQIDLSEAHLFFCYGPNAGAGACPDGGWWPDAAFDAAKQGVCDAACFPYTDADQSCNLCSNWQDRLTRITGWHSIAAPAEMKEFLSSTGPLTACFTVYDDFYAYGGGVYHHVTGELRGGHCVSIVGYDDGVGCWICKNSWGTTFGESGFFRIAYGDCGIDATMWAAEGVLATGWETDKRVIGLWTIDEDRNAWAYVDTVGWRKVAPDNDNVFHDILGQLIAAKTANRPVSFLQDNGVIQQVYVF